MAPDMKLAAALAEAAHLTPILNFDSELPFPGGSRPFSTPLDVILNSLACRKRLSRLGIPADYAAYEKFASLLLSRADAGTDPWFSLLAEDLFAAGFLPARELPRGEAEIRALWEKTAAMIGEGPTSFLPDTPAAVFFLPVTPVTAKTFSAAKKHDCPPGFLPFFSLQGLECPGTEEFSLICEALGTPGIGELEEALSAALERSGAGVAFFTLPLPAFYRRPDPYSAGKVWEKAIFGTPVSPEECTLLTAELFYLFGGICREKKVKLVAELRTPAPLSLLFAGSGEAFCHDPAAPLFAMLRDLAGMGRLPDLCLLADEPFYLPGAAAFFADVKGTASRDFHTVIGYSGEDPEAFIPTALRLCPECFLGRVTDSGTLTCPRHAVFRRVLTESLCRSVASGTPLDREELLSLSEKILYGRAAAFFGLPFPSPGFSPGFSPVF